MGGGVLAVACGCGVRGVGLCLAPCHAGPRVDHRLAGRRAGTARRRVAPSLLRLLLTASRRGKRQRAAAVFRPEAKMATFEVFQREAKPLSD